MPPAQPGRPSSHGENVQDPDACPQQDLPGWRSPSPPSSHNGYQDCSVKTDTVFQKSTISNQEATTPCLGLLVSMCRHQHLMRRRCYTLGCYRQLIFREVWSYPLHARAGTCISISKACFRQRAGVVPVAFRKTLVKWACERKPTEKAI